MAAKTLQDVVDAVERGEFSQRALARAAGVSTATVNHVVRGQCRNPRINTAAALVDGMGALRRSAKASSKVRRGIRKGCGRKGAVR